MGDTLELRSADGGPPVRVKVIAVRHYFTLREFIVAEWQVAVPQAATGGEALALYQGILSHSGLPAFSHRRVTDAGGMCAIEIVRV